MHLASVRKTVVSSFWIDHNHFSLPFEISIISHLRMELYKVLWMAAASVAGWLMLTWAWRMVEWLWWRPRRLERELRAQGLRGTRYRPLFGDLKEEGRLRREALSKPISPISHSIYPRVSPFFHRVMENHGNMCLTWFGPIPRVSIIDPEMIREILSTKFGHFEKPEFDPLAKLLATGLATYNREKWAMHRRIINPAFHQEKLKIMMPSVSTCCDELITRWATLVGSDGSYELDVWPELRSFTSDLISRMAFGSSYKEGRQLFQLQDEQAKLFVEAKQNLYIPGYRFLPTKKNKRRKEINREVIAILRSMIEQRETDIREGLDGSTHDLLDLLIESNLRYSHENRDSKYIGMSIEDVIEECKLFYFAGHDTTSVLLTWTMIVLSMNPIWQARAREEVLQVLGENKPGFDDLSRLKIGTTIIYEVLRLYPPASVLVRQTYKETKLGDITLPPGVQLLFPIIQIHRNVEFWGADAGEFKPERFAEGVSKASKNQGSFFPFGWGPRICIGQGLAMLEVKMSLATILRHFSFELSPSYAHAPYTNITLQPQYGAQIILHKL